MRNRQNLEALQTLGSVAVFSVFKGHPFPSHDFGSRDFCSQDCRSDSGDRSAAPTPVDWTHVDLNRCQRPLAEKVRRKLRWLRPFGHYYTDWIYTEQAARQFRQCLEQTQPSLIVLEELWLFPYLSIALNYRQRHPGCKVILDNHNVEGLLASERTAVSASGLGSRLELQLARWEMAMRPRRVRRMERRALALVDQMWVCSAEDKAAMVRLYGGEPREEPREGPGDKPGGLNGSDGKLVVIPNSVNPAAYRTSVRPVSAAPTLLFLGSYGYRPNAVAARLLWEEVYPLLRPRYGDVRLLLVGREPTAWMEQLAQTHKAVEVPGQVDSVLPYLQRADVLVVPLHHGSGTRLKLLEAFAAGVPVVSTAKGAEGLAVRDGQHLLLREDAAAIAAGVAEILDQPALAQTLAAAAHRLVVNQYSWQAATEKVQTAVAQLLTPQLNREVR